MEEINVEQQKAELERQYLPPPPMKLIYKILLGGIIGTFFSVLTIRYYAPKKVPHLVWRPDSNNDCLLQKERNREQ